MTAGATEAPEMHHHIDRFAATPSKDVIVGGNIARLRRARKISPKTFAALSGLSETELNLMEIGSSKIPPGMLLCFATALHCTVSDLMNPDTARSN